MARRQNDSPPRTAQLFVTLDELQKLLQSFLQARSACYLPDLRVVWDARTETLRLESPVFMQASSQVRWRMAGAFGLDPTGWGDSMEALLQAVLAELLGAPHRAVAIRADGLSPVLTITGEGGR